MNRPRPTARRHGVGRLPFKPLEDLVLSSGRNRRAFNVDGTYLKRWRDDGLDPWKADEIALSVGYFPFEVWGRAWEIAAIADELDRTRVCPCGRYFIATVRARPGKYCGLPECPLPQSKKRVKAEAARNVNLLELAS